MCPANMRSQFRFFYCNLQMQHDTLNNVNVDGREQKNGLL